MSNIKIIIDDREHAVVSILPETTVEMKVERIETGDYCIFVDDELQICIERKTWSDLAASLKDGRNENIGKMLNLREQTACKLFFLIQGSATYADTRQFGGIDFVNLKKYLDSRQLESDIHVIYCKGIEDVIPRIITLGQSMCKLAVRGGKQSFDKSMAIIKKKHEKTPDEVSASLWRSVKGIGQGIAEGLVASNITIKDVFLGVAGPRELSEVLLLSGKKIGPVKAGKIHANIIDNPVGVLTAISGVSKDMATTILDGNTMQDILEGRCKIENIMYGTKKIGSKRAERIYEILMIENPQISD